jgi:hypothetical protein
MSDHGKAVKPMAQPSLLSIAHHAVSARIRIFGLGNVTGLDEKLANYYEQKPD